MTSERDFDRLARAWLELGPDEAPDRVVTAVLQAAETTPQVRRPMRWHHPWRLVPMTRLPVAAGAVAILVVAVGGALLIRGNAPNNVAAPPPTQTANPAPSVSPKPTALSNELTSSSWVAHANAFGYPRLSIGSPVGPDGRSPVSLSDGGTEKSLGDAASTAADILQIRTATTGICDPSMVGTYGLAVSADKATLTLSPSGVDPCAD